MSVDPRQFRDAMGHFATGVTVVTVGGDTPHGMTANSFTSVSLDPPLVLVCVGRDAVMHRALTENGHFAVSVLGAHQEPVARHFADRRRPLGQAQFDSTDWRPGPNTGAPLIAGARFELPLSAYPVAPTLNVEVDGAPEAFVFDPGTNTARFAFPVPGDSDVRVSYVPECL